MKKSIPFTEEQKSEIRALAKSLRLWQIARLFECTDDKVKRVIDPTYAERRAAQVQAARRSRGGDKSYYVKRSKPSKPNGLSAALCRTTKTASLNTGGGAHQILANVAAPKIDFDPLAKANASRAPKIFCISELTDNTCRWPIGDIGSPKFGYCGDQPVDSKPYCEYHCSIAYESVKSRNARLGAEKGWETRKDKKKNWATFA